MIWKYTDETKTIIICKLPDGGESSCLVSALPKGDTIEEGTPVSE